MSTVHESFSFYMNASGRCGTIVYYEADRSKEMYWEMSGSSEYDILLAPLDLREWDSPKGVSIETDHQVTILHRMRNWLDENNYRSNISLPKTIEMTGQSCAWSGCSAMKIEGSAFCLKHYDINLLVL